MIEKPDLKLSKREQYIFKSDMSLFGCDKLGTFCNAIFKNYYESFPRPEWEEITKKISSTKQIIGKSLKLQNDCCTILDRELTEYEKEEGYTESLNNRIASNYVHLLLKEYAKKEMYERERIYFKKNFDSIKNAWKLKEQIRITTSNRKFQCSVYDIISESGNTYIICKSAEIKNGKLEKWEYASFRFLYITEVREVSEKERAKALDIEDYEKIDIQDKILYNGIQFFLDKVDLIKVRFSDAGMKKYNSIRHLRPFEYEGWNIKSKEKKAEFALNKKKDDANNIKTFKCTKKQIEYYLFQFGGDAEILEPTELREQFLNDYKKAVEVYSKTE